MPKTDAIVLFLLSSNLSIHISISKDKATIKHLSTPKALPWLINVFTKTGSLVYSSGSSIISFFWSSLRFLAFSILK